MGPDWFRGFSSLAALIRSRSSFEVAQWLEAEGPLSVLFLAGADDTSAVPHGTALQLLRQFRPDDPLQVQLLAIAGQVGELECGELSDSSRLGAAVSASGGSLASICSAERAWGTLVGQQGQRAFRPGHRELVGRPASGAAVELLLNGTRPPVGWRYEAATNSLSFAGLDWPRPGDTVTARYRLGCQ